MPLVHNDDDDSSTTKINLIVDNVTSFLEINGKYCIFLLSEISFGSWDTGDGLTDKCNAD